MSEASQHQWKEKYLSALEEFEHIQKEDQLRLELLRRGMVRVSLAADGLDETLDEQLDEIRTALRGDRDIKTLEPLIAQLERTVVTLEDRRKSEHSTLATLVDEQLDAYLQIGLPRATKGKIKSLRKAMPNLLPGNQLTLELWKQLQFVQNQVTLHFTQQLEASDEPKSGIFARLFQTSKPDIPNEPSGTSNSGNHFELDSCPSQPFPAQESLTENSPGQQDLPQRLSQTLCNLLNQLDVPTHYAERKAQLFHRVQSPFALDQLPELLDEATQLVASTRLSAQKEFEGFLITLHQRLQDIQSFLDNAKKGEERSEINQQKLDEEVRQELKSMQINVQSSGDISQLKLDIESMVTRIVSVVDSFHLEEKKRRDEMYQKIDTLGKRMESMETEATSLKNSLESQRIEALRDALTELPNRAAYDEQIGSEYSRWKRHEHALSLAIIDVDHFKRINDTLGHLPGDKVLKLIAREINRRVRNEDFVARYGGEEFVVIMPETAEASAVTAMEKVRAAVEACPFNFNNERVVITVSIGVSSFQKGDSIEACFERADKALYYAKETGRNRISSHPNRAL